MNEKEKEMLQKAYELITAAETRLMNSDVWFHVKKERFDMSEAATILWRLKKGEYNEKR